MTVDQRVEIKGDDRVYDSGRSLRLKGRTLAVARVGWVIIALAAVGLFIAGVPLRYRELQTPCAGDVCASGQLTAETMAALQNAGLSIATYAALILGVAIFVALVY